MAEQQRTYIAIDLKSFYASVECVDRGLDPLTTNLVVADASRTEKTICLAVSPSLKEYGIGGRARLFEVYQKARGVDFIIAPPRMAHYIEVSTQVYKTYLKYIAPEDIHVYSIDEVFADVQKHYDEPLAVEKLPLKNFYTAEEYHQDYLDKNPDGYCHLPLELFKFAKQAKEKKD